MVRFMVILTGLNVLVRAVSYEVERGDVLTAIIVGTFGVFLWPWWRRDTPHADNRKKGD